MITLTDDLGSLTIAAITAVIAGHIASAQVLPVPSIKTVTVPKPSNLGYFVW